MIILFLVKRRTRPEIESSRSVSEEISCHCCIICVFFVLKYFKNLFNLLFMNQFKFLLLCKVSIFYFNLLYTGWCVFIGKKSRKEYLCSALCVLPRSCCLVFFSYASSP